MPLPQQVQERAEAANRYFDQLGNTGESAAQASAEDPAREALPENDNGQIPGDEAKPEGEQRQAEHQQHVETEQGAEYWRHRFNVEAGRLRTATDENRTLKETLRTREQRIAELEQSAGQSAGSLTAQEVTNLDKLKDEYGPDLIDAIQQMIQSSQPKTGASDERLEKVEQRLQREEQERQDDLKARFWQEFTARVPNFREINADQGFLTWLSGIDSFSGVPRQQLLEDAQNKLDAGRLAGIFEAYSKDAQATGKGEAKSAKREIPEDQVQPRQSRSVQSHAQDAKIWTQSEIKAFYEDKRKGVYSAAEGKRIEDDIFAAQQQGRIQ